MPFLHFPICAVRKIVPLRQLASIYCRHTGGRVARGPSLLPPQRAVEKIKGVRLRCFELLRKKKGLEGAGITPRLLQMTALTYGSSDT